ncbi:unnamed protein product [Aphanomyces euteiches]
MFAFSVLAGCTKSDSAKDKPASTEVAKATEAAKATDAPKSTEAVKKSDPVPLTMMVQNHPARPLKSDWLVWQQHDENANVKLTVSGYQGDWWDAIPIVVASGDMPDLMWMSGNDMVHRYGADGAIVNLMDNLDKMPNLKAWMDKYPEEVKPLLSTDGKLFLHPSRGAYGTYDGMYLYREDIFKKNNLQMPQNFDELYATLLQLKKLYPDSTPLYVDGMYAFTSFGYSFNTENGFYYNPDDKAVKFGPMEENYKKLVEFMAKAYKDKLIPVEFGNMNGDKFNQLLTTDKTFIYYGYVPQIDSYNLKMKETNPDFKLAHLIPPKGPTGKQYDARKFILGEGLTVSSKSKHKDAALQYIDYLFTEKARDAVSWGKEGVTYEVVDGKKKFLPVVKDQKTAAIEFGLKTSGNTAWFDDDANVALMSEDTKKAYEEGAKYVGENSNLPAITQSEDESIKLKNDAIGKYYNENISKFVLGAKPMSDWDSYIEGLKKLGVEDVLKVYNDALARANK